MAFVMVAWAVASIWLLSRSYELPVRQFAQRYRVTIDDDERGYVASRLRRSRALRATGAGAGIALLAALPMLLEASQPDARHVWAALAGLCPVSGYLIGHLASVRWASAASGGVASSPPPHRSKARGGCWLAACRAMAIGTLLVAPLAWSLAGRSDDPHVLGYRRGVVLASVAGVVAASGLHIACLALIAASSRRASPVDERLWAAFRCDDERRALGATFFVVGGGAAAMCWSMIPAVDGPVWAAGASALVVSQVVLVVCWWRLVSAGPPCSATSAVPG